jgi:hypothetical protein
MLSRVEFEKAVLQEARRADRKHADEEKRRRRRMMREQLELWLRSPHPRLDTLEKRLVKLHQLLWLEDGSLRTTDSNKIEQYRRLEIKLERMTLKEARRSGCPAWVNERTILCCLREQAQELRDTPEDRELTDLEMARFWQQERFFDVIYKRPQKAAVEKKKWREKKKTPEGRAERLEYAQFLRKMYRQPVKTMAASA